MPVCPHTQMGRENGQTVCLDCGELLGDASPAPAFASLAASEMLCPSCKVSRRVLFSNGEYSCTTCWAAVGTKAEQTPSPPRDDDEEGMEWMA